MHFTLKFDQSVSCEGLHSIGAGRKASLVSTRQKLTFKGIYTSQTRIVNLIENKRKAKPKGTRKANSNADHRPRERERERD